MTADLWPRVMGVELLIIIPVLNRPARAIEVFKSATENTDVPHRVLFICSLGDEAEIEACRATGAIADVFPEPAGPGDWAKKLNYAYRGSFEPWLFCGADDLRFHPGWASEALTIGEHTQAGVVGTNDLGNPRVISGRHSTHPLIRRRYADERGTIDQPRAMAHEGYDHQFVDDEIVQTAIKRGEWAFARASVVEHLHPFFEKAPMDSTYEKGLRATARDRALFVKRRRLIRNSPHLDRR